MVSAFFPSKWKEKYQQLLQEDFEAFLACSSTKAPRMLRPNLFRITASELINRLARAGIVVVPHPFFQDVLVVRTPDARLGLVKEHREGLFVVQDLSSMVPAWILQPSVEDVVLDLCAAPGMKTTQLAERMQNRGAIVAVDENRERLKGLRFNLNRLGILNTLVVKADARFFHPFFLFDKILLDAPCSSDGVVRKRADALKNWSPVLVERKAVLQKKLLENAFSLLRDGGVLVYSTCTFAPEENEAVVQSLLEKHSNAKLEKIEVPHFKFREAFTRFNGVSFLPELKKAARVFPQDNDSEAFFVAKIRKVSG